MEHQNQTHDSAQWQDLYAGSIMNTFGTPQLVLTEGHGAFVKDADGKEYMDLLGGIAVNVLGQCHPAVVAAIQQQAATLGHVSNFFATPPQIELAEALLKLVEPADNPAPEGSRVFLTNSGTESNEAAIKIVRAHGTSKSPGKTKLIALNHAFHGRSTGALALTWKEPYRAPFAPLIPGVEFIDPTPEALEAAIDDTVCGVFVEPIQGEAGVREVSDGFLRAARELTQQHDALLVLDEVQSGMGRTGDWMAHHRSGIVPDVVTLAKGVGAGMPIGACIALGAAGQVLKPGMHGTTFGGNPLCAAAALATIGVIEDQQLLAHTAELGEKWRRDLSALVNEKTAEVRGRGLLIGIELAGDHAAAVVETARAHGFIVNAATPSTVRLAPPLNLTVEEAATFTAAFPAILEEAIA